MAATRHTTIKSSDCRREAFAFVRKLGFILGNGVESIAHMLVGRREPETFIHSAGEYRMDFGIAARIH